MSDWRPLHEADDLDGDFARRVIIAGYYYEMGQRTAHVGEAFWGDPDEGGSRWIWAHGGDVVNALSFQEFPDFPIASQNSKYVVGRKVK